MAHAKFFLAFLAALCAGCFVDWSITMQLLTALNLQLNPASPAVIAFVGGGGKSSALFRLTQEMAETGQRVLATTTTHISPEQLQGEPVHITIASDQLPVDELARALDVHGRCLVIG